MIAVNKIYPQEMHNSFVNIQKIICNPTPPMI